MKKTLFALIAISAIIIIHSCKMSEKKINRLKSQLCHDYTIIEKKDSLIKIPIYYTDSAFMQLWLACDSNGQIYQTNAEYWQGKYSSLESRLVDNKVIVHNTVKIHDTVFKTITNTKITTGANIVTNELTKGQKRWVNIGKWSIGIASVLLAIILFLVWLKNKTGIAKFFVGIFGKK